MMDKEYKLKCLWQHMKNLENAKTFEDYKAAHIHYIQTLMYIIEGNGGEVVWEFVNKAAQIEGSGE